MKKFICTLALVLLCSIQAHALDLSIGAKEVTVGHQEPEHFITLGLDNQWTLGAFKFSGAVEVDISNETIEGMKGQDGLLLRTGISYPLWGGEIEVYIERDAPHTGLDTQEVGGKYNRGLF